MSTKQEYLTESTESLLLTLSHEILDKLQAIESYTTFVLELDQNTEGKLGPNQREWLEAILVKVDDAFPIVKDMSGIIQMLGSFSMQNDYPSTDLGKILQAALKALSTSMSHCQLHVDMIAEAHSLMVCSPEPDLLHRSLELVLGYLAALTPDGGLLHIDLSTSGKQIHLSMQGVGVRRLKSLSPAEAAQSLVEGAPSVDAGMDVARKIVQVHGGDSQSDDTHDRLTLNLPLAPWQGPNNWNR